MLGSQGCHSEERLERWVVNCQVNENVLFAWSRHRTNKRQVRSKYTCIPISVITICILPLAAVMLFGLSSETRHNKKISSNVFPAIVCVQGAHPPGEPPRQPRP